MRTPCLRSLPALLLLWLWAPGLPASGTREAGGQAPLPHPGAILGRGDLERLAQIRRGGAPSSAIDSLLAEARAALSRSSSASAVLRIPAYYMEPEAHMAAKAGLSGDARAAYTLALASWIAGEPERTSFGLKAAAVLTTWATANQSVSGADGDLVLCYAGLPLLLAADLIWEEPFWGAPRDRASFAEWTDRIFRPSACRERRRPNNRGDWGTGASIAAAYLLDDREQIAEDASRLLARIGRNIDSRGELPRENRRTASGMWYTYFALAAADR